MNHVNLKFPKMKVASRGFSLVLLWPPMLMHGRPLYFAQVLSFLERRPQLVVTV